MFMWFEINNVHSCSKVFEHTLDLRKLRQTKLFYLVCSCSFLFGQISTMFMWFLITNADLF